MGCGDPPQDRLGCCRFCRWLRAVVALDHTLFGDMGKVRAESRQWLGACPGLTVALAMPLLTGSCIVFGTPVPRQKLALTIAVAPSTAAYLIADLVRRQIRGADPLPASTSAPILWQGGERYTVRYSRHGDDGFRVFLNGRITPPARPTLTAEIGPCPLQGCRFVAAGVYTGSPLIADRELYIEVQPCLLAGGIPGCRVEGYLEGLPDQGEIPAAIRLVLGAAATIRDTAALLRDRQFRAVEQRAAAAVALLEAVGHDGRAFLLSRLLCHRAAAAVARGDLVAARVFLGRALDHDQRLLAARYWLFTTDKRLANLHQARRNLSMLAHSELDESLQSRAQAGLMKNLRNQRRRGDPKLFEQRAREALEKWDLAAAYAWARQAIGTGSTSPEIQSILARVHGLRAEHQLAFEEELVLFRGGLDQPQLVARMAERHLALGNAPAGLRLLALNWNQVLATDHAGATALLERLLREIKPELACRILVSAGTPGLAKVQLQKWRATGDANEAAIPLLERVPALRAQQQETATRPPRPAGPEPRTGFETAPGVQPRR